MRVDATIEVVRCDVLVLGEGVDPPGKGVAFRPVDGKLPGPLFVDGVEVGELVDWPDLDVERIYRAGDIKPLGGQTVGATLRCQLDIGPRVEGYSDADLLEQIRAECTTALELDDENPREIRWPGSARVLLRRFVEKIEAQRKGEKWWDAE